MRKNLRLWGKILVAVLYGDEETAFVKILKGPHKEEKTRVPWDQLSQIASKTLMHPPLPERKTATGWHDQCPTCGTPGFVDGIECPGCGTRESVKGFRAWLENQGLRADKTE